MYSRCPHCDSRQQRTVEQLRHWLVCTVCGKHFDGLRSLGGDEHGHETPRTDLAESAGRPPLTAAWAAASMGMLLLLLAQAIYFEASGLSRQPLLRAGLQSLCTVIACQLPAYRNLDELLVSRSDLQAKTGHVYLFTAVINNRSPFPQAAPELKLTLLNFNGQPMAERVFSPRQYLPGGETLPAEQTAEIRLDLVRPTAKVGGYTFVLL